MSEIENECVRLAKLAWPDRVALDDDGGVSQDEHNWSRRSRPGIAVYDRQDNRLADINSHPRSTEAMLAALRVLAGEPDQQPGNAAGALSEVTRADREYALAAHARLSGAERPDAVGWLAQWLEHGSPSSPILQALASAHADGRVASDPQLADLKRRCERLVERWRGKCGDMSEFLVDELEAVLKVENVDPRDG